MYLDDFINQQIQIKLRNFPEELTGDVTGIHRPDDWYMVKLVATEGMGIWVENPCLKRTEIVNQDGDPIPSEEQKEETCAVHLLIRWEYISSVLTFPTKDTVGVDEKATFIGFQPS
ncbi:hypothetical protein JOC78_002853 [Bacillus ectoiniformans]|uniref:hypothetical protein n=1 Tax=Bacillus ectoiniformans TaxID=1494429 RepID=UPI00195C6A5F|nr:hypothetical protein [Bacillus ectoiniformans]MBM7649869.1 hypothetical protein [Bacillus ectoiniformans]